MTAPFAGRALHFIGIGGAGMSGLALVARRLGATVTGSDQAESSYCERLREAGIEPVIGHDAANVPEGAEVVVSTAIPEENPELAAARAAGARVLHRGDLLGELSRMKRVIAVGGTHGKTTTASMAALALLETGRDPAFLIGGELRAGGTNAAWGEGEWAVIEADESDRSFLKLKRDVAVVTNIELDHHATYANLRELEGAFEDFVQPADVWVAGPGIPAAGEVVTFGIESGDLSARNVHLGPGTSDFEVEGVPVALRVPGAHNVLNALAALAALRAAGVPIEEAAPALAGFTGAGRRFERHGTTQSGADVYDDYAHHPTEVRATLEAARTLEPRRLVACFQPHLYSRTRMLAREFGRALALADLVVVLDVYRARERPDDFPGVSGYLVAEAAADFAEGRPVWWLPGIDDAERHIRAELAEGDVLLTLGAGDVDELARRLSP
ncbi:MAG TPA: UDP-N-acetylmuramate--L-alanine ligase [Thermoleophilaceae bacterium]|nr:UDP-N-acetylmuramate--L-alanine ligase [Thermoleophilaceae bacterium]